MTLRFAYDLVTNCDARGDLAEKVMVTPLRKLLVWQLLALGMGSLAKRQQVFGCKHVVAS